MRTVNKSLFIWESQTRATSCKILLTEVNICHIIRLYINLTSVSRPPTNIDKYVYYLYKVFSYTDIIYTCLPTPILTANRISKSFIPRFFVIRRWPNNILYIMVYYGEILAVRQTGFKEAKTEQGMAKQHLKITG